MKEELTVEELEKVNALLMLKIDRMKSVNDLLMDKLFHSVVAYQNLKKATDEYIEIVEWFCPLDTFPRELLTTLIKRNYDNDWNSRTE